MFSCLIPSKSLFGPTHGPLRKKATGAERARGKTGCPRPPAGDLWIALH